MPSDAHLTSPQFVMEQERRSQDIVRQMRQQQQENWPLEEGPGLPKHRPGGEIGLPENEGGPYEQTAEEKYQRSLMMGGPDFPEYVGEGYSAPGRN